MTSCFGVAARANVSREESYALLQLWPTNTSHSDDDGIPRAALASYWTDSFIQIYYIYCESSHRSIHLSSTSLVDWLWGSYDRYKQVKYNK